MSRDLIAKLEAASEGSRELDVAIHHGRAAAHKHLPSGFTMKDLGNPHRNRGLAGSKFIYPDRGPAPHYTTSIDAALTLVPEGWTPWDLIASHCTPDEFDAAPALALTIAALRARE